MAPVFRVQYYESQSYYNPKRQVVVVTCVLRNFLRSQTSRSRYSPQSTSDVQEDGRLIPGSRWHGQHDMAALQQMQKVLGNRMSKFKELNMNWPSNLDEQKSREARKELLTDFNFQNKRLIYKLTYCRYFNYEDIYNSLSVCSLLNAGWVHRRKNASVVAHPNQFVSKCHTHQPRTWHRTSPYWACAERTTLVNTLFNHKLRTENVGLHESYPRNNDIASVFV
jgi:hypothetical protein